MTTSPTTLDLDSLHAATADEACAGIRICVDLEPLGGRGTPINPAIHSGGVYDWQRRYIDGAEEPVDCIVIDSIQSQAARLQRTLAEIDAYPQLELDLSGEALPAHLPEQISSVEFPHRHADAYLRDAVQGTVKFDATPLGEALLNATASRPEALLGWFPHSLIYGFWQSHTTVKGKKGEKVQKGPQSKHPRVWTSEIVGWRPSMPKDAVEGAARRFERRGTKGDPLNIDSNAAEKGDLKPSEVGHGQVPFGGPGSDEDKRRPPAMSFARITQEATLSFATLRRVADRSEQPPGFDPVQARTLLAVLALWAYVRRFGSLMDLRTGTTLTPVPDSLGVHVIGGGQLGECSLPEMAVQEGDISKIVEEIALPAGLNGWGECPVVLHPNKRLRGYIANTWPAPDSDDT